MSDFNRLHIEPTAKVPNIDFNAINGELILSGRSIPENAARIYEPVYDWVKEYVKNPRSVTNLRLNLDYFNTSTTIWLAKIVKALSKISLPDYVLFIHLYFDIDDFDEMQTGDLKQELGPILDIVGEASLSIGVKIYGIDETGSVIKENMILI